MLPIVLSGLVVASPGLLPWVHAEGQFAHDLGLDPLRGRMEVGLEAGLWASPSSRWHVDIHAAFRVYVRANRDGETFFRISPTQIHFPVGARIRFPLGSGSEWGLFARHQSNHDVDEPDAALSRETVSYEIYGAELVWPGIRLAAGLYYDRGTRLDGTPQLPFDYYLAGLSVSADRQLAGPWYAGGQLSVVAHRNGEHTPPHLNVGGWIDSGVRLSGAAGTLGVFLRFERIEDFRRLGDEPHHLLMLGTSVSSR